jgi:hypothetical protein
VIAQPQYLLLYTLNNQPTHAPQSTSTSLNHLQIDGLLALLMLLPLVLIVRKLEPQLVVVLDPQQLLLTQPRLEQIVVVYEQIDVHVVYYDETM